jgi:hypothetical protein
VKQVVYHAPPDSPLPTSIYGVGDRCSDPTVARSGGYAAPCLTKLTLHMPKSVSLYWPASISSLDHIDLR